MKITPKQYAQVLVESIKEDNVSDIAKAFWYKLQKNGQHKDLGKIIAALDQEYAKLNNKILAQVYSEKALDDEQLEKIGSKLKSQYKKEVIVNNIVNPRQSAGLIVKVDGTEINLSLENKITRLKSALINNT
jgi:F0F1-type ATP synthase delta subunit